MTIGVLAGALISARIEFRVLVASAELSVAVWARAPAAENAQTASASKTVFENHSQVKHDRSFNGCGRRFVRWLSAASSRGKKTCADWSDSKQPDWSDSKTQRDACSAGLPSIIRAVTGIALHEVMPDRRGDVDRDQREQDIGHIDVQVLVELALALSVEVNCGYAKQTEPVAVIRLARARMRPAEHRHQNGDAIQRAVVDARRDPLPPAAYRPAIQALD